MIRLFAQVALSIAVLVVAIIVAAPVRADDPIATMVMQGDATVSAAPDQATLTTGVVTQAETARKALDANTAAMTALVGVLKSAGIADRDIQTSGFSVQPRYVKSDRRDENGYSKPPAIAGYQVSNNVDILVRDLDKLGGVLDQVVSAGSNTIGGVTFSVADPGPLRDQARKKAIADAMAKARLYADAAGQCLVRVLSIAENGGYAPVAKTVRAMAFEADAAVPVQSGEVGYSISVNMQWQLAPAPCAN